MVDVSEKMIEAAWNAHRKGVGLEARPFPNTREDCRQLYTRIYTAMHSAREVDAQAIGQIKHDLIAARDRLSRAIEELIDSEVAAIAAMGEGDVR